MESKFDNVAGRNLTPALHKNVMQLRGESSSFCQRFEMGGKKLGDFLINADGEGENASGFAVSAHGPQKRQEPQKHPDRGHQ
jgi:hypothetical protein